MSASSGPSRKPAVMTWLLRCLDELSVPSMSTPQRPFLHVRHVELLVVLRVVDDGLVHEGGVLLVHADVRAQVAGHDGQVHQADGVVEVEVLLARRRTPEAYFFGSEAQSR